LTKEYLLLETTDALNSNLKLYIGDQIPEYLGVDKLIPERSSV